MKFLHIICKEYCFDIVIEACLQTKTPGCFFFFFLLFTRDEKLPTIVLLTMNDWKYKVPRTENIEVPESLHTQYGQDVGKVEDFTYLGARVRDTKTISYSLVAYIWSS